MSKRIVVKVYGHVDPKREAKRQREPSRPLRQPFRHHRTIKVSPNFTK